MCIHRNSSLSNPRFGSINSLRETTKSSICVFLAVVLTFAVIIAYTLVMQPLGFCLSTILFLFLQMLILAPADKRNLLLFAVVAVAFTALVYVAFRVGLQQLLPRGIIESLLGF